MSRHPRTASAAIAAQQQAEAGAVVLARYRHPDHWIDGRTTLKQPFIDKMLLKVEEIRLGGLAFVNEEEARCNATTIRAWAASVGLPPHLLLVSHEYDKAPYLVVPKSAFNDKVLPHLRALSA